MGKRKYGLWWSCAFIAAAGFAGSASGADFAVTRFGAKAGAAPRENAAAIQRAIDAASEAKGTGRVVVPPGVFESGTIWLKGGVELHLERGAVLRASGDLDDYNAEDAYPQNFAFTNEQWNARHFIICHEQERVAITGEGVIDGNGERFFEERPVRYFDWMKPDALQWWNGIRWAKDKKRLRPGQLVVFVESRDCLVSGVTITNSPCWCLFFHGCENVTVRDYTCRNNPDNGNTDGVDIDCCENVLLEDLDIDTGDDAVAIRADWRMLRRKRPTQNIVVRRARLGSTSSIFRIGLGDGVVRNVLIENCSSFRGGPGFTIQGADFENITVRDCDFRNLRLAYQVVTDYGNSRFGARNIVFDHCGFDRKLGREVRSKWVDVPCNVIEIPSPGGDRQIRANRDYTQDRRFMRRYFEAAVRCAETKVSNETAYRKTLDCKLPIKPRLSSGLRNIFLWDAVFCCLWAKHVPEGRLPVLETLDNLYLLQQEDGFICREHSPDGRPVWTADHPTAYNPPILSWAEEELFRAGRSGPDRLKAVYPKLVKLHECYRRHLRRDDGLYAGDILGGGMDDVPRWPADMSRDDRAKGGMKFERRFIGEVARDGWYWDGFMSKIIPEHSWNFQAGWIDMSAQMAFDALNLARIARAIGLESEAEAHLAEHDEIAKAINAKCWDEERGFYFDCGKDGPIRRYTVASFWVLIAKVAPADRVRRMVAALRDPNLFGRPIPVPSLAKCDVSYAPETGYWTGAVWPPTTYMTIRGLCDCGEEELAEEIARKWYNANAQLFEREGTFFENISPEQCERPKQRAGREFCGWGAIAAVCLPGEFGWLR